MINFIFPPNWTIKLNVNLCKVLCRIQPTHKTSHVYPNGGQVFEIVDKL